VWSIDHFNVAIDFHDLPRWPARPRTALAPGHRGHSTCILGRNSSHRLAGSKWVDPGRGGAVLNLRTAASVWTLQPVSLWSWRSDQLGSRPCPDTCTRVQRLLGQALRCVYGRNCSRTFVPWSRGILARCATPRTPRDHHSRKAKLFRRQVSITLFQLPRSSYLAFSLPR
jgi:hypothetical protein